MGIENSLEGLNLSPSVQRVAEKYIEFEAVSPEQVINDLLEQHPDYGEGLAGKIRLPERPSSETAPIQILLDQVMLVFEDDRVPVLHTRIVVIGLVLTEPRLTEVGTGDLLPALARELHEPLEQILTPDGLKFWKEFEKKLKPAPAAKTPKSIDAVEQVRSHAESALRRRPRRRPATPAGEGAQQASPASSGDVAQQTSSSSAARSGARSGDSQEVSSPPADVFEQVRTALRALADTPTLAGDSLRFGDYADALVEFIENPETGKPLTIGIDAAWGMGKTSLMYMVRERLDPGSVPVAGKDGKSGRQSRFTRFRTVWFNAWKYDREEALWAALALEILAQTRRRFGVWQRLDAWFTLNRERFDWGLFFQDAFAAVAKPLSILLLGAVLFIAGASALGQTPNQWLALAAAVGVSGVYGIGSTAYRHLAGPFNLKIARYMRTPNYAEKIGFLSEFEADFRRVVSAVTQVGKWPLVVFVDDLDRCGPKQAVEVVEAINSVLDTEHCIFVIAMDAQAVAASIEAKYHEMKALLDEDPGGLTLGERFLEKIIQINFRIPRAEKSVVEGYIGEMLTGRAEPREPPVAPRVREAERLIKAEQRAGKELPEAAEVVGETREVDRADAKRAEERIREESATEAEQVRLAVIEAAPYLENNPRKIKRFINTFRLQALVAQKRGMLTDPAEATLLARALIIATRWPDLVEGLIPDRGYVDRLLDVEATQSRLAKKLEETWGEEEKRSKAELDRSLESPRLKRLVTASELLALLKAMPKDQRDRLADYLVLARTATK